MRCGGARWRREILGVVVLGSWVALGRRNHSKRNAKPWKGDTVKHFRPPELAIVRDETMGGFSGRETMPVQVSGRNAADFCRLSMFACWTFLPRAGCPRQRWNWAAGPILLGRLVSGRGESTCDLEAMVIHRGQKCPRCQRYWGDNEPLWSPRSPAFCIKRRKSFDVRKKY